MVVATEVFMLFGETGKQLRKIAMEVAKKWAGVDQAASGLLITFLEKSVPSATSFLASLPALPLSNLEASLGLYKCATAGRDRRVAGEGGGEQLC